MLEQFRTLPRAVRRLLICLSLLLYVLALGWSDKAQLVGSPYQKMLVLTFFPFAAYGLYWALVGFFLWLAARFINQKKPVRAVRH